MGTNESSNTCACGCGEVVLSPHRFRRGHTTHHGQYGTPTYCTWQRILRRCTNKNDKDYSAYGGSGIGVSDEWRTFDGFFASMGEKPEGHSIDRIDNSEGYSPENCRWADKFQQANNKTTNVVIEHDGKTLSLQQWGTALGIKYRTLRTRWDNGDRDARLLRKPFADIKPRPRGLIYKKRVK